MQDKQIIISFDKKHDGKVITFHYEDNQLIIETSTKYEGSQHFSLDTEEIKQLKQFLEN